MTNTPIPTPTPTIDQALYDKAHKAIVTARVNLILKQPFFGSLVLRLKMVADEQVPTACTDGTHIRYNPAFMAGLSLKQIEGVCCHEVLHCACGHIWREKDLPFPSLPKNTPTDLSGSDLDKLKLILRHDKANQAMDYAINPIIIDSGMELPPDCLNDPKYKGMSMEEIYVKLPNPKVQFSRASGMGSPNGNGDGQSNGRTMTIDGQPRCGDVEQPNGANGNTSQDAEQQNEWQVAVAQAAQAARMHGKLPAHLEKFLGGLQKPQVDWKALLRRFVQDAAKQDYNWNQPNRRFLAAGLYLPRLYSEELGPIVIAQDTSGSMWSDRDLRLCASELRSIIEDCKPHHTTLYYADAAVADSRVFERGEPFEFAPKGGGGTSFVPVFDAVRESGEEPLCLIYFTDLQGTFPTEPPPYPVIWLTVCEGTAPFGEVLRIDNILEE